MSENPDAPIEQPLTRDQIEAVLATFSAADWQRARFIAGTLCGGVTGWDADDLLQEAITKFLEGDRTWPGGFHPLVVLKSVMHSIASNTRKHNDLSPVDPTVRVDPAETGDEGGAAVAVRSSTGITPEDILSGKQQLEVIQKALADDEELELLAMAWAEGVRGEEACRQLAWDSKKHDAVRKRLSRRLEQLDPQRSKQ